MAKNALPDQAVLLQSLQYDPDTGVLLWKPRQPEAFSATPGRPAKHACALWNSRYVGTAALNCIDGSGYRAGHFMGKSVKAHRAIWKMMTGYDPVEVDHIDGCRTNNTWNNLRDVTLQENQKNACRRTDNSSGVTGVTWYPHQRRIGKWLVKLGNKHIGMFDDFETAVAARKAAEMAHGFHENHGRAA